MPHQPQPGDVLIAFTNGAYNDGTRAINLRIEDETTHKFIVDIDLDGPTFAALVSGRDVRTGGYTLHLTSRVADNVLAYTLRIYLVDAYDTSTGLFKAAVTGEDFAAILGNAVTRVSGAHILKES